MIRRLITCLIVTAVSWVGLTDTASAQQSAGPGGRGIRVNFLLGTFAPRGGFDDPAPRYPFTYGRADSDVLSGFFQRDYLTFDIEDFRSTNIGAEVLFPLGEYLELGSGFSYSNDTVAASQTGYFGEALSIDRSDVIANIGMRIAPLAFTARVLPLGRRFRVQPYVGGGVGLFWWRINRGGEYADDRHLFTPPEQVEVLMSMCSPPFPNLPNIETCPAAVFDPPPHQDLFTASGLDAGAIVLFGVRFDVSSFTIGGEIRYQHAIGDLPPLPGPAATADTDRYRLGADYMFRTGESLPAGAMLPGNKVDLVGWTYQLTTGFRFR